MERFGGLSSASSTVINWNRTSTDTWPAKNSPFINAYAFEVFDVGRAREMMIEYRQHTIALCVVYLVTAFWGQSWMKNRPPFNLRRVLTIWNSILALFSIVGFLRTVPEFYYIVSGSNGFHNSVCSNDVHNYATAFWALIFTLSKIVELGDTAFIVLRKQPLTFLHWYHHMTVLLLTWVYYEQYEPAYRWMGTMNYFVHACMYTYFTLRSLRIRIPRNLTMMVTILQISQMIVGFYINIYTFGVKQDGVPCERSMKNIYFGILVYGSYTILFINFFFWSLKRRWGPPLPRVEPSKAK